MKVTILVCLYNFLLGSYAVGPWKKKTHSLEVAASCYVKLLECLIKTLVHQLP